MGLKFTIIIIGRTVNDCQKSINSIRNLKNRNFNLIISTGKNPSAQRNEASKVATGDYLLFLDNDSEVSADLLDRYYEVISMFDMPDIIGGPAIYLASNNFLKNSVKVISSSAFGFASSKARYTPIGEIRSSNENELILCNLCINRAFFINYHGFRIDFYPHEENEFLERVRKKSITFYHPLAIVKRESIGTYFSFIFKLFNYGSGRAKHYIKHPNHFKVIYLLPSIFTIYIMSAYQLISNSNYFVIPLSLYLFLAFSTSIFNCFGKKNHSILLTAFLFLLGHLSYGAGYLYYILSFKFKGNINQEHDISIIEM
jgi:GT2 family glycosyltransferase